MGRVVPLDTENTTTIQMALQLFDELADANRSLTESSNEVGFKRNRLFLDISELSLLSSKALDTLFFMVAQDRCIQQAYDIDLEFFKWMMSYTSNNHRHLRKVLKEVQRTTLEGDASNSQLEKWGSKTLLTSVSIYGGRLVCEMDPVVQKLVKDPDRSYFYSLRISSGFSSVYAHRLYNRLLDYIDTGDTGYQDLDVVRNWLGCNLAAYKDYGEFNRTALKKALSQINECSNFNLAITTKNVPGSKAVEKLRFTFSVKQNWRPRNESLAWSKELFDTLKFELALNQDQFDKIRENRDTWTDERIQQAVEYTRHMAKKSTIDCIPRYFMAALEKQWRVPALQLQITQQQLLDEQSVERAKTANEEMMVRFAASPLALLETEAKLGLDGFSVMSDDEQTDLFETWRRTKMADVAGKAANLVIAEANRQDALANEKVARAFGSYVFNKLKATATTTKG